MRAWAGAAGSLKLRRLVGARNATRPTFRSRVHCARVGMLREGDVRREARCNCSDPTAACLFERVTRPHLEFYS